MSSMLKLLTLTVLATSSLFAASATDELILKFERKSINPQIKIDNIAIAESVQIKKGWTGYILNLDINVRGEAKKVKDMLFTDGRVVTRDLLDLRTGTSYKSKLETYMYPKLGEKYYNKANLVSGNPDAEHKVVVFSDPVCPYCVRFAPEMMEKAQKQPGKVALYYYHFPLSFHESAKPISLAMIAAAQQGVENVEYRVYKAFKADQALFKKAKDPKNALEVVNGVLGTSLTQKDLQKPSVAQQLSHDMQLSREAMVKGTPTIFVDGRIDKSRNKLRQILE